MNIEQKQYADIQRPTFLLVLLGFFILLLDFSSKFYIQKHLPLANEIVIFQNILGVDFSIVHATNKGAAWGLFASFQSILMIFRMLFVAGLGIYFVYFNQNKAWKIPLTLIFAGALGNIIDYFHYGYVIDFLSFNLWGYDYPVFNIADSTIFIGIFWILITSFFGKKHDANF